MSIRSDEQNIIAAKNREIAALKAQVKGCCGNLLVTYGPEVIAEAVRQAKIDVLKEVLADDSCDTCHWYGVITEMLEQLEASNEQSK